MKPLDNLPNWQKSWVVANWKMNPSSQTAVTTLMNELTEKLNSEELKDKMPASSIDQPHHFSHLCNVVIAPSFIHLYQVKQAIENQQLPIALAAQNICAQSIDKGAFTGEVSAMQLRDSGVDFVIIGHSERRQYFAEDNACLANKINCALAQDLTVILCIGETEQQYEQNQTQSILAEQLAVISDINPAFDLSSSLIIAYEPVWAIGTGKVPTMAEVEAIHAFIQQHLTMLNSTLTDTPILYGGSVKADNATDIAQCPHVSGVLVGGASLVAISFTQIIQAFSSK